MKHTHLKTFLQTVSEKDFAPIYLVIAKDAFDRKQAVEKLLERLGKNKAVASFDAVAQNIPDILNSLRTLSLFGDQQIVIVNHLEELTAKQLEPLMDYVENPSKGAILIGTAETLKSTLNFYKTVDKAGTILEIAQPDKPWEKEKAAVGWLQELVAEEGKRMDQATAQFMIQNLGSEHAILHQEVEKLVLYVGERKEITIKDVSAICGLTNQETVWQLGEAIFRGDSAAALRIMKAQLEEGQPFLVLIRQLRTQFMNGLQICSLLAQGGGPEDVVRVFPYLRGNLLQKQISQSQGYGLNHFRKGIIRLDTAELQAKNSSLSDGYDTLADILLIKLCNPKLTHD